MIDFRCTCGHLDSEHICSEKAHKRPGHICDVTNRVFCCNEDINDPPWSCPCKHFKIDNLRFLESLI
jgi:hypothetical protein